MDTRLLNAMRILAVAFAVVALAGCGNDSDHPAAATPSSTPAATSTATAVATNTPAPSTTATAAPTATATSQPAPTSTATTSATATGTATPTDTPTASPTPTQAVPNPLIEGPITGGRGVPWLQSTSFPLTEVGYMQSEFFMSGIARAYTNVGELGPDGAWLAVPAGTTAAYRTRIVVYRPIDPEQFNGTVLVEWFNVSGGLDAAPDWTSLHTELTREGYAWVGVSAQLVGIEGGGGPFNLSLKTVDAARYGSLHHPGDSFSYDIFSQTGQAVLAPDGLDPLDGLRPERVIAVGESQSAFRLVTYINAIHPLVRLYDGFLVHSRGGGGAPLSQAPEADIPAPSPALIRTDLQEPVLTFETETDLITLGYLPARQPDGPLFRLWEVAGTAHADTYALVVGFTDRGNTPVGAEVFEVAEPIPGFIECDRPINSGPQHFVLKAAIAGLDRWVRGGEAPPIAPRLELAGEPPEFVLDDLGNVRGGIRTAHVDAPIATLSGLGQTGGAFCRIFGTTDLFDAAMLASLYPDHAAYIAAVNEATDSAVEAGFLLAADALLIKQAAEESNVPPEPELSLSLSLSPPALQAQAEARAQARKE